MGIVNITPDSFYAPSRTPQPKDALKIIERHIAEGANIIDIGACSTRPGSQVVGEVEEWERLEPILELVRTLDSNIILSVDTFRSSVACKAVEQYGVQIINDISGGDLDNLMFQTIANLGCAYVLTHTRSTPREMLNHTRYAHLLSDVTVSLNQKLERLTQLGVKDVIIDPGFGFAKTTQQNWQLLRQLSSFHLFSRPLLIGISRKTMLQQPLSLDSNETLNATSIAHTIALLHNADIVRTHNVKETEEVIKLLTAYHNP